MTNATMGEAGFEAGGVSYTCKLGTHAQAMLERRYQKPIGEIFERIAAEAEANNPHIDDLLALLHAGLYRNHKLSEEATADLIDAIGKTKAYEVITEAMVLAARKDDGSNSGDPTKAPASQIGTAH